MVFFWPVWIWTLIIRLGFVELISLNLITIVQATNWLIYTTLVTNWSVAIRLVTIGATINGVLMVILAVFRAI